MLADSRSQLWGRAWSTDDPRQRREAALWLKEQILEMEMRVKLIQEREDEEARRIQAEHRLELQRRAAARNRGFQDASSDY